MTDRARRVYALLRSLLDWVPSTPGSRSHALSGFDPVKRRCLNCVKHGPSKDCRFCNGTGQVTIADPMQKSTRVTRMIGDEKQAREDAKHATYRTIERIASLIAQHDGEEVELDALTRASTVEHDRQYAAGSYAELEQLLEGWLRSYSPAFYALAWSIAYAPFVEVPVDPPATWLKVAFMCELLAQRMPATIRVPSSVPVFSADELQRQSREAKDAFARGRSSWASASRVERKRMILELHAEGVPDGKIALRLGLSRQRVQEIRAGLEDVCGSSELGGTAA